MMGGAATDWFAFKDGRRVGPMTAQELVQLATAGRLSGSDLIWCKLLPDWVELRHALDLRFPLEQRGQSPAPAAHSSVQPRHSVQAGRPSLDRNMSLGALYLARLAERLNPSH